MVGQNMAHAALLSACTEPSTYEWCAAEPDVDTLAMVSRASCFCTRGRASLEVSVNRTTGRGTRHGVSQGQLPPWKH